MKRWFLLVVLGCQRTSDPLPDPVKYDPLIVHEWGTFATFQGSAGALLDGMQHETEALPPFVHSITSTSPSPFAPWGDDSLDSKVGHVGGKMETPVLYFYSQTQRRVRVHVDFTHGLMTQWWPAAASAPQPVNDVASLTKTSLDWDLEILPGTQPPGVPVVSPEDPWSFARETSAAWVRAGNEAEKYVFYRGLGRIELPLRVHALDNLALIHDCSDEPLTTSFVLDMRDHEGRFTTIGALNAHQAQPALTQEPLRPREAVIAELTAAVTSTLEAQGLFADEARAMVRTWTRTWFAANGTRVIYIVPPKRTEAILPLTIDPKPDSLVRVLVGRHEFLTPARETEIVELLKKRLQPATRESATRELAKLGRFLEPAVRRAIALGDPVAAKSGEEILATFKTVKP
jgi:hypothetical protein